MPFIRQFKAIENIAAGDLVIVANSGELDDIEAMNTALAQAAWVDSDAVNKMVTILAAEVNPLHRQSLQLLAVAGQSTNDYADNTISSINLTGYTVKMIIHASAVSGDFEFLLASGANAATANVKQAITVSQADNPQLLSFTVAGMTADNGSFDVTAVTHAGFRCVDDTGAPSIKITDIWFEKTGTTYVGVKKARTNSGNTVNRLSKADGAIGISPNAITAGNFGSVVLFGPIIGGYTDVIPSFAYQLSSTAGLLEWDYYWENINTTVNFAYVSFGVGISSTEIMLFRNTYGKSI